jgi:excisionase family DNA binding protein
MISRVRSELGLTITELATILGVERPTIYAWLSETVVPYPRNRRRLQELYRIALAWSDMSRSPVGDSVRWEDETGKSIVALLRRGETSEVLARLKILSSARRTRPASDREARREALRRFTEKHDIGRALDEEQESLDTATGKRMSPE